MPTDYCSHYSCRCDTAAELAWMSQRLGRNDLLQQAVDVHSKEVRCRHIPRPARPGADQAPLPPYSEPSQPRREKA